MTNNCVTIAYHSIADLLLVQRYMKINNKDCTESSVIRMDRMLTGIGYRALGDKNMYTLTPLRNWLFTPETQWQSRGQQIGLRNVS